MAIGRKGDRPDLWEWGKNKNLLSELERSLEQYDTIFLVLDEQKEFSYLWEQYHKAGKHKEGKRQFYSVVCNSLHHAYKFKVSYEIHTIS